MKRCMWGLMMIMVLGLYGCSANMENQTRQSTDDETYEILQVLPKTIEGFNYVNAHTYPEPWGYSLRYVYQGNQQIHSDIYIYPVPEGALKYQHKDIVAGMTSQALREIEIAMNKGMYSDFNIINKRAFKIQDNITTRVDVQLVRNNWEMFSLLFVTERNGTVLKARMTMPYNELNKNNEAWQKFVEQAFSIILGNLDKA